MVDIDSLGSVLGEIRGRIYEWRTEARLFARVVEEIDFCPESISAQRYLERLDGYFVDLEEFVTRIALHPTAGDAIEAMLSAVKVSGNEGGE